MANGEIAHHKQFLHSPQCFQKLSGKRNIEITLLLSIHPAVIYNLTCWHIGRQHKFLWTHLFLNQTPLFLCLIRCSWVVSVGDFKLGTPSLIPSHGTTVMVECLSQGTFPSLVLVCLPRDHEYVKCCYDITEIILKAA